jgi:hypothetical protein
MVIATANSSDTEKLDLKSLPGGFVVAKRLTYGQKLQRRQMVSGLKVEAGKGKDFAGEMNMVSEKATVFDFQHCIVEHNLGKLKPGTEDEEIPIDFGNVQDVRALDPRVGEEIDNFLSELNNFEESEEGED